MMGTSATCEWSFVVLHCRLYSHVPQPLLWFLSFPQESSLSFWGFALVAHDSYSFFGLCAPLRSNELLGCDGYY